MRPNAKPKHQSRRQTIIGLAAAVAIIASWLSIHVYAVILADPAPGFALGVVLFIAQLWLSVGLFIVAHDAMHGSLAPHQPRLNTALGTLCVALYAGFSYARLYPKHHQHHEAPGSAADPDFSVAHPRQFAPWFKQFMLTYFGWREFAILTLAQAIYILLLDVAIWRLLTFWALPAIAAAVQLFYFGTYLPHRHTNKAFIDRHNARSTRVSKLISLLSCYHFGGYHHEHHLAPWVPWWDLPQQRTRRNAAPEVPSQLV